MPRIDPTITLGSLLSMATVIVAIALAWGRVETRMVEIDTRANSTASGLDLLRTERAAGVLATDARIRALETAGARSDAQLRSIESIVNRIDGRLERMEQSRQP